MVNDLLTRIKNAGFAGHEYVQAPFSNFDFAIAKVLEENGFIARVEKRTLEKKKNILKITLKYHGKKPAISDFKIISKPSRRLYAGYRDLKTVKRGYGIAVLSTPEGILTDKQAKKKKVGGEELFHIW